MEKRPKQLRLGAWQSYEWHTGRDWGAGERKRSCEQERRRHHEDGPRGPSLGGSRPLPLSPDYPSARSLGLSCWPLRIPLTQDQPACAKPSTLHGPSCPGKQEVRVSAHLEEQGAGKASPGLPFCEVLQTLLTERALKGKERAHFIDSSALASQLGL